MGKMRKGEIDSPLQACLSAHKDLFPELRERCGAGLGFGVVRRPLPGEEPLGLFLREEQPLPLSPDLAPVEKVEEERQSPIEPVELCGKMVAAVAERRDSGSFHGTTSKVFRSMERSATLASTS